MDIIRDIVIGRRSLSAFIIAVVSVTGVAPHGSAQIRVQPQHLHRSPTALQSSPPLYDHQPTPYCKIIYDLSSEYAGLESEVTSSNPAAKTLAQFVLEAFAQANTNNGLLDSQSESDAIIALTDLQSMWIPSALDFKTYYTDTDVTDANTVQFVIEQLIQVSYRFPKLLAQYGPVSQSGTIENLLSTLLAEGVLGVINEKLDVSYTNAFLTKVCNLVLLGQGAADGNRNVLLAADSTVLDTGRTDLMSWFDTVRTYGVHEFISPTYTGLDLEMLANIQLFAQDPGIATMGQQGYKEAWIDVYANWCNQDQRLGGTHSRTYEFLTDENRTTDRFIYAASNPLTVSSPAWPHLLTQRLPLYWRGQDYTAYMLPPPSDVPNLFPAQVPANTTQTILRDFGYTGTYLDPIWMYGENYMANPSGTGGTTYPFLVGSTESQYLDPTFEGLTIMLPGNGNTTNLNFNMQGRGDYYLQELAPDGKSGTLQPYIAAVQNGAETLFLATSDLFQDSRASSVASTIVIPNSAQIWIGNDSSPVSLPEGQSTSLAADSTIFIQITNSGQSDALVTGIRFLLSTDMRGSSVGLSLVNDGSQYNALRVSCIHAASTPSAGNAVFAFWTRTGYTSNLGANFNAFRTAMTSAATTVSYDPSSGEVSLSVPGWNTTMSVQANTVNQSISALSGSDLDSALVLPLLSVNGQEYLTGAMQSWSSQNIGNTSGGDAYLLAKDGLYTGQVQVIGGTGDIWGTADSFEFYYEQLVGDGTVIGRLANLPTGGNASPWAMAGLMMRNDLSPGSMNGFVSLDGTHGQRFSFRNSENGTSSRTGNFNTTTPYWFKITRVGNTFTGYSAPDGKTWSQVGDSVSIPMNQMIYVGIGVTNYTSAGTITTVFDNTGFQQQ